MAYQTKFDGRTDKTIRLGGDGNATSIEGYFLGTKDTEGEYGPGKLHLFQTQEGIVGVWGKTRMNNLLTNDHRGQMVLLSFTGMIAPSKKGRRPSYGYKLQFDPENTIDVSGINLTAPEPEEDSDAEFQSEDSYQTPSPQPPTRAVHTSAPAQPSVSAPPSADRQAKMRELLKSRVPA